MGSFSIWHWLIVIILFGVPLIFIFQNPPLGRNRFGLLPQAMGFSAAIGSFFKNYANFSGRASRSEFWFAYLFVVIISVVLTITDPTEILSFLWSLATLLPCMAISSRRLHDINRSGWHQLLAILFPIGSIALIVWYCKAANDGDAFQNDKEILAEDRKQSQGTLNSVEALEMLAKLKESGALSSEEYETEKRKILGKLR